MEQIAMQFPECATVAEIELIYKLKANACERPG